MCWSSSQDDPENCNNNKIILHSPPLLCSALEKLQTIFITWSVVLRHQCSNSCKPAFRYSPLLNEQHSRRSNKLPYHKFGNLMSDYNMKLISFWKFYFVNWSWNSSTHLLKSCTLMNEKTWLKIFFVIIEGTWISQKSDESAKLEKQKKNW